MSETKSDSTVPQTGDHLEHFVSPRFFNAANIRDCIQRRHQPRWRISLQKHSLQKRAASESLKPQDKSSLENAKAKFLTQVHDHVGANVRSLDTSSDCGTDTPS